MPARRRATPAASTGRPTAITSLQNQEAARYRKWLVHGESDTGKTVLAGTAPNNLFLSTDIEGTESAKALGSQADELRINTFAEFCAAVQWIGYGGGAREYEWITVDTITELEELCWQEQLVSDEVRRASKYQPSKGDYPFVWAKLKEQLSILGRAPVNTLFVAHTMRVDRETEDGEDTVTLAMPAIGSRKRGDLSSQLCAQHGVVGYMRKATGEEGAIERQLLTQSGTRWIARDRTNKLGAGMVDPSIPKMLARISGGENTPARAARRRRSN
jgi:hypothetical protein